MWHYLVIQGALNKLKNSPTVSNVWALVQSSTMLRLCPDVFHLLNVLFLLNKSMSGKIDLGGILLLVLVKVKLHQFFSSSESASSESLDYMSYSFPPNTTASSHRFTRYQSFSRGNFLNLCINLVSWICCQVTILEF